MNEASSLTNRQRQIARLVWQGYRRRDIASALSISEKIVKSHLGELYDKLMVSGRVQLAIYVERHFGHFGPMEVAPPGGGSRPHSARRKTLQADCRV